MCRAVEERIEKAAKIAAEEATEKAKLETTLKYIKNAMESFHVSLEEAMSGLKLTQEEQEAILKKL